MRNEDCFYRKILNRLTLIGKNLPFIRQNKPLIKFYSSKLIFTELSPFSNKDFVLSCYGIITILI